MARRRGSSSSSTTTTRTDMVSAASGPLFALGGLLLAGSALALVFPASEWRTATRRRRDQAYVILYSGMVVSMTVVLACLRWSRCPAWAQVSFSLCTLLSTGLFAVERWLSGDRALAYAATLTAVAGVATATLVVDRLLPSGPYAPLAALDLELLPAVMTEDGSFPTRSSARVASAALCLRAGSGLVLGLVALDRSRRLEVTAFGACLVSILDLGRGLQLRQFFCSERRSERSDAVATEYAAREKPDDDRDDRDDDLEAGPGKADLWPPPPPPLESPDSSPDDWGTSPDDAPRNKKCPEPRSAPLRNSFLNVQWRSNGSLSSIPEDLDVVDFSPLPPHRPVTSSLSPPLFGGGQHSDRPLSTSPIAMSHY